MQEEQEKEAISLASQIREKKVRAQSAQAAERAAVEMMATETTVIMETLV